MMSVVFFDPSFCWGKGVFFLQIVFWIIFQEWYFSATKMTGQIIYNDLRPRPPVGHLKWWWVREILHGQVSFIQGWEL